MSRRKPGAGDYEVGYGRPPLATRFQPGRSGNPSGRRKARKTISDDLDDALMAKVKVVENGRTRSYTAQQVILRNVVAEAARKNLRALSVLMSLAARYGTSTENVLDPEALPPEDAAVLQAFVEKVRGTSDRDSGRLTPIDDASRDDGETKPGTGSAPVGSSDE